MATLLCSVTFNITGTPNGNVWNVIINNSKLDPTRDMDVYVCVCSVFVLSYVGSGLASGCSPSKESCWLSVRFTVSELIVNGKSSESLIRAGSRRRIVNTLYRKQTPLNLNLLFLVVNLKFRIQFPYFPWENLGNIALKFWNVRWWFSQVEKSTNFIRLKQDVYPYERVVQMAVFQVHTFEHSGTRAISYLLGGNWIVSSIPRRS
jgi:hypothetical protein